MKKMLSILFLGWYILAAISTSAQNLDYFNTIGNMLLQDIGKDQENAFLSKEHYATFLEKVVFPNVKEKMTDQEKASVVSDYYNNSRAEYSAMIKGIKNYLTSWEVNTDELSLFAKVPMGIQVLEYVNEFNPSDPQSGDHNISTQSLYLLIGNQQKRMILPVVFMAFDGTYQVVSLDNPISAFEYTGSDYEYIQYQLQQLIETALLPSDMVNDMVSSSPLYGDAYDENWNLCAVQLIGSVSPTLIKKADDSGFFVSSSKEIKLEMLKNVDADKAYSYMIDLLTVFFQEYTIQPSETNQLDYPANIKVYANRTIEEDETTGAVAAHFDIKNGSGDRVIFKTQLTLASNNDGTANLTLGLFDD